MLKPTRVEIPEVPERTNSGLSSELAAARLNLYGPNSLVSEQKSRWWSPVLKAATDPMGLLLLVAGTIYLALGSHREAIILFIALIPVLGVDLYLELKSENALKALRAAFRRSAKVVRDGVPGEVPTEVLVPGDLLLVEEGNILPADAVLMEARHILADESILTGESVPLPKKAGDRLFAGSTLVAGEGKAVVAETGMETQYGRIARLVEQEPEHESDLGRQISRLVRGLGILAIAVALALLALERAIGRTWNEALVSAVSLAMAAVPAEFPLVFTLFLSMGAWRLSRKRVLVRNLKNVETLGSTSVICTDKTGTLTEGKFELKEFLPLREDVPRQLLLECAVLACEPDPADAMERAIYRYVQEKGMDPLSIVGRWKLEKDYPFDPERKMMSHLWREHGNSRTRLVAKGALEGLLSRSAITLEEKIRIEQSHSRWAASGRRVLALAFKEGGSLEEPSVERSQDEAGLTVIGLLGFEDPVRPGVREAIRDCQRARIQVKMLTGDHPETAQAIAESVGLNNSGNSIFARITPRQKYQIIDDLVRSGEIVAMTGDGVNDAPALKRADIGISMGKRATDAARAAAGLVLLDDDFTALVAAVFEGRRIFENIQRAFLYLIGFHVPILGMAVLAPAMGWPLLLLPLHMVWLELIVHPVVSLAFESEAPSPLARAAPPRRRGGALLPKRGFILSMLTGLAIWGAVAWVYVHALSEGALDRARTLAVGTLIVSCVLLIFVERASGLPIWRTPLPKARRFWIVVFLALFSLPALVHVRVFREALAMAPVSISDWGRILAFAAVAVGWRSAIMKP